MTTTEDWEFLLRAAEIAGVTDIDSVVAIYQWWKDRETSKTLHSQDEWLANQREVERRIDAEPLLLPAGEPRKLRKELLRLKELERIHKAQLKQISRSARRIAFLEGRVHRQKEKREVAVARLRKQGPRQDRRRSNQPPQRLVYRRGGAWCGACDMVGGDDGVGPEFVGPTGRVTHST